MVLDRRLMELIAFKAGLKSECFETPIENTHSRRCFKERLQFSHTLI